MSGVVAAVSRRFLQHASLLLSQPEENYIEMFNILPSYQSIVFSILACNFTPPKALFCKCCLIFFGDRQEGLSKTDNRLDVFIQATPATTDLFKAPVEHFLQA